MQVKKFEARTMKEALEMVKSELGPEAIILSARDNNKSYGLVGDGSVEITAAVSEETLQRKKFAEARLREQDKDRFSKSSARSQKDLIEKMVTKHLERNQAPKSITSRRYIDIEDESAQASAKALINDRRYAPGAAEERNRQAAKQTLNELKQQAQNQPSPKSQQQQQLVQQQQRQLSQQHSQLQIQAQSLAAAAPAMAAQNTEMAALKSELANLRQVLAHFQSVPQNFVQAHPGAEFGVPYDLSFAFEKLTTAGVAPEISVDICGLVQKQLPVLKLKNRSLVEGWVARHILESTKVTSAEENASAKVHVFVGAAGSGKTTALVKMASHLVVRENKRVAILSADTFKVGAADQMRIYAQILNVPFTVIRNPSDWYQIMNYMNNVDYILVDCPGLSLRNSEEGMMLKKLLPPATLKSRVHLVLSTLAKDQDVTELGRRYSVLDYKDVIFTGLDESAQHGTIYNFMRRFDVPLHAFGIGTRVPEDFEFATKERVLDLLFKITQAHKQEQKAL
jgi:flagellar biosynthesis protein FlhF